MLLKIALLVCSAAGGLFSAEEVIKTSTGEVYHNATIISLAPSSIGFECDEGIVRIAPEKLPEHIQKKYGYLPKVADVKLGGIFVSAGIDSGIQIEFKEGRFDGYWHSGAGNLRSGHFTGDYSIQGNWVLLNNPKMHQRVYAVIVVGGQQFLLDPREYKTWRETGDMESLHSVMRRAK